ncbi:hypothetical protein H6G45_14975 [Synechocystis sp. FACHB-383]|uniref:hypothetical protein n=1 Tax=Synechocystis sp. FACHB-383 TaxID=2692864 RepID=UPI00168283DB|nr:hypothetical protein [Synechocystis sp. FACHB-383]MBD2654761.1 hypothetical protein [Synechocystis sp. FACHB-383]
MEKEYLELDGDRQKSGKLPLASAERGPWKKRMFATVALVAGNDVNCQLQILIEQAKKLSEDGLHPTAQTLGEREILSQAMALLQASGKLWRNYQEQYADAYAEAWLKTLEYFYRHYREYDPSKAQVATWLNFRLKNEFKSQQIKIQQQQQRQIQASTEEEGEGLLAMMASPSYGDQAKVMSEGIAQWLEESPQLAEESIKNQPQLTVKVLLEQRFLREVPWGDLAKEYNVSVATLSSFYERKCRPKLVNFIQSNYDFITPDTPVNPCEHLRSLLTQKQWHKLNLGDRLQQWLESEPCLQEIRLREKPEITAQIFLRETLAVLQQPRQGLIQVANRLGVEAGALERFYEFRVIHQVLAFMHKIQREQR